MSTKEPGGRNDQSCQADNRMSDTVTTTAEAITVIAVSRTGLRQAGSGRAPSATAHGDPTPTMYLVN
jgi:hypothetical protein